MTGCCMVAAEAETQRYMCRLLIVLLCFIMGISSTINLLAGLPLFDVKLRDRRQLHREVDLPHRYDAMTDLGRLTETLAQIGVEMLRPV